MFTSVSQLMYVFKEVHKEKILNYELCCQKIPYGSLGPNFASLFTYLLKTVCKIILMSIYQNTVNDKMHHTLLAFRTVSQYNSIQKDNRKGCSELHNLSCIYYHIKEEIVNLKGLVSKRSLQVFHRKMYVVRLITPKKPLT